MIRPPLIQQGGQRRSRRQRQRGGGYLSTERYFGVEPSLAAAGVAPSTQATSTFIRPPLLMQGGKRTSRRVQGGFYPGVMGSFVANAESFMPMLASVSAYKMYRSSKKTKRNKRR